MSTQRVAYVCADPGIPVFGTKGASVHIQELVRAWRRRGADVEVYAVRRGSEVPADLADLDFRHFWLQPMDGARRAANTAAAVAYCMAYPAWRLSLQTHKLIGIP